VQVSFQCEDQTVAGALAVRVDRAGRFEQRTKRLVTLADVGSDTDVTIRGRLTDRAAEGTIDAHARAFYNAGTTFECTKDRIKWRAASTDDPGAERVERFLPARADALAVTENAVFVDEEQGDKASTVKRLDPHSGKAKWTPGRRRRSRRGKRGAVWIVSGATGRVIGLDARSGRVAATTVGPGRFDAIAPGTPQPIAVAPDSVWVATAAGLVRLGPTTGHEKARVPGGCSRDRRSGTDQYRHSGRGARPRWAAGRLADRARRSGDEPSRRRRLRHVGLDPGWARRAERLGRGRGAGTWHHR
jgi:hypothetical protein